MKMEKVAIWGNSIPGNSAKSKLDDMEIDRNKGGMELLVSFIKALTLREYHDEKVIIDTFTWKKEIEPGKAKETYEDVPYLTPFPVEGSKKAVIVVPGGGFAYLSSDDDPEGLQGHRADHLHCGSRACRCPCSVEGSDRHSAYHRYSDRRQSAAVSCRY